jgi:uncharacterized protein YjbI with pentapeptide repeats
MLDPKMMNTTKPKLRCRAFCLATSITLSLFGPSVVAADGCDVTPVPGVDLRGCFLNKRDLSNLDLSGADLRKAQMITTNLNGANLTGADLRGANMSGADLRNANFTGANLTGAFMVKAMIGKMKLTGAQLDGLTWNNMHLCAEGSIGECK